MLVEDEEEVRQAKTGSRVNRMAVWVGEGVAGPALDGEGSGGGEEAGHGEGDEQARGDGQIGLACQRQGEGHDDGGDADLKGSELAGRDSMGGVAKARRWPAKAIAQARVSRSPGLMLVKRLLHDVPAGVVRRRRPEKPGMRQLRWSSGEQESWLSQ